MREHKLKILVILIAAFLLGAYVQNQAVDIHGTIGTKFVPLQVDDSTHSVQTITYAHHEVHSGSSYFVTDIRALNDAATFSYLIECPDTTSWAHILFKIEGSFDTKIEIYEATTKTAGTAMTEWNRNRNSANTAGVVVTHTPGGAGNGNLMWTSRFGNDSGPAGRGGSGGGTRGNNEFVLKQNTDYLVIITSYTDNNNVAVEFDWYEHTDKD